MFTKLSLSDWFGMLVHNSAFRSCLRSSESESSKREKPDLGHNCTPRPSFEFPVWDWSMNLSVALGENSEQLGLMMCLASLHWSVAIDSLLSRCPLGSGLVPSTHLPHLFYFQKEEPTNQDIKKLHSVLASTTGNSLNQYAKCLLPGQADEDQVTEQERKGVGRPGIRLQ